MLNFLSTYIALRAYQKSSRKEDRHVTKGDLIFLYILLGVAVTMLIAMVIFLIVMVVYFIASYY